MIQIHWSDLTKLELWNTAKSETCLLHLHAYEWKCGMAASLPMQNQTSLIIINEYLHRNYILYILQCLHFVPHAEINSCQIYFLNGCYSVN